MIPWYDVCFMHESTQLNGNNLPRRPPPPKCCRTTVQRNWHQSIQFKFYAHATGRTGSIVYIHAVARHAEQQRTGNLHFFMIKTQATPNIQHFIYSILLTDNHDNTFFSVIKHIVHLKKKYQTIILLPRDPATHSITTRRNHRTT